MKKLISLILILFFTDIIYAKTNLDCLYLPPNNGKDLTYWLVIHGVSTNLYMIIVNGIEIKSGSSSNLQSTVVNGIQYNRGKEINQLHSKYTYFEVCK